MRTLTGVAALFLVFGAGCVPNTSPPPAPPPARTAGRDTMPPVPPDPRKAAAPRPANGNATVGVAPLPTKPVEGSAFNKLFPKDGDGFNITYTQEKKGFALAELSQGGKKLAQLSISDCAGNPSGRDKFQSGGAPIAGYPSAPVGSQGTAILVGDRYQVQVRSATPEFSADQRTAWLKKFDLHALEGVK